MNDNLSAPLAKMAAAGTGVVTAQAGLPAMILGLSLSDWAAGLTAIFVIFQIIVILPAVRKRVVLWVQAARAWLRKGR